MDNRKLPTCVFKIFLKLSIRLDMTCFWAKSEHYGIRGLALDWFRSCLTDRVQQVSYADAISSFVPIICGVPQGSILGPLLFLLMYVNYIANFTNNLLFYLFADHVTVFISGEKGQDLASYMSQELIHLNNWFHAISES